jgi:hypothetical protein
LPVAGSVGSRSTTLTEGCVDARACEGALDCRCDRLPVDGRARHDVDLHAAVGLDDAVVDDGRLVGECAGDGERVDLHVVESQHVSSTTLDAGPNVAVALLDHEAVVDAIPDELMVWNCQPHSDLPAGPA